MTRHKQIFLNPVTTGGAAHLSFVDQFDFDCVGVEQSVHIDGRIVASALMLTRKEAEAVVSTLQAWLNETDPAYIAHAERESAKAAIPATDDEWKARLAEGCKS